MNGMKLGAIILLVAGVVSFLIAYNYHGYHIYGTLDRSAEASVCPPQAPIYVNFRNYTNSTVRGASFVLEMFEGRNSSNLLSNQYFQFERIVPRFSSQYFCYADPYIDQIIGINEEDIIKEGGSDGFVRIDTGAVLQQVNRVRELHDKFSVYISSLRVETIE